MKPQLTTDKPNPTKQQEIEEYDKGSTHGMQQQSVQKRLYLHLQLMLQKSQWHYNFDSQYYQNKASKQQLTTQTIKYLTFLQANIVPLPHQHTSLLLFLINYFNAANIIITNRYCLSSALRDQNNKAKFHLGFSEVEERIDFKQFVKWDWGHLFSISFYNCGWLTDDDWRVLVQNAGRFENMASLFLWNNKIKEIREGDIEQFKALKKIDLSDNPLSQQSKEVLKRLKQKNSQILIHYEYDVLQWPFQN